MIDIGAGAGINGGNVVAIGKPNEIKKNKKSITGRYLSKELNINIHKKDSRNSNNNIELRGANGNNLGKLKFPLNKFISITSVSGGGSHHLL